MIEGPPDPIALRPVPRADYRRGPELARGRASRIISAHDLRHDRPVAIKELVDQSPAELARFLREAMIAGRLPHPAIVPVYQAGVWEDDRTPFFAMRMVSGPSLANLVAGLASRRERLALVPHLATTADALALAHAHGIVHGDLALSRVLVDRGETLVLGWGRHATGGDPSDDIRQLGAMVAELVVAARGGGPADLRSVVARATAAEPAQRYADAGELAAELRRFVAGEPVAAHRYWWGAVAARWAGRHRALMVVAAAVVVAALGIATVAARSGAAAARVAARERGAIAERARRDTTEQAAARVRQQRELTEQGRSRLRRGQSHQALAYLSRSYALGDRSVALRYLLARAMRAVAGSRLEVPDGTTVAELSADGRRLLAIGPGRGALLDAADGRPIALLGGATRVAIATNALTAVLATSAIATVLDLDQGTVRATVPVDGLRDIAISADGRLIALVTAAGRLQVHDAHDGAVRWVGTGGPLQDRVALSLDGALVETCGSDRRCTIRQLRDGRIVAPPPAATVRGPDGPILAVLPPSVAVDAAAGRARFPGLTVAAALAPAGDRLATAEDATVTIWDTSTGDLLRSFTGDDARVVDLHFDATGRSLAVIGGAGTIRIWDVEHGLVRAELPGVSAHGTIRYTRDGGRLLTLRGRHAWLSSLDELGVPAALAAPVPATSLAFHRDGSLAVVSAAGVWIRDPRWRQLTATPALGVRFAPGGDAVAIAEPTQLSVQDPGTGAVLWTSRIAAPVTHLQWHGDRILVVTGETVEVHHARDGRLLGALVGRSAATLVAGDDVVSASGRDLERREAGAGSPRWSQRLTFEPTWADASDDGTWMVAGDDRGQPTLWDLARGAPAPSFEDEDSDRPIDLPAADLDDPVERARLALRGSSVRRYLALIERRGRATPSGMVEMAELHRLLGDCREARQYNARAGSIAGQAPLHIARAIEIQRRQLRACHPRAPGPPPKATPVADGAISRDGSLVITASRAHGLRIWDRDGRLLELRAIPDLVDLELRPDGRALAVADRDGRIRVWDLPLEERSPAEVDAVVRRLVPWRVADDGRLEPR